MGNSKRRVQSYNFRKKGRVVRERVREGVNGRS